MSQTTSTQPGPTPVATVMPPPQPQPPPQRHTPFRRLHVRHKLFKIGCGVGVFAFLVFIVGFSAPAWIDKGGLWMDCTFRCTSNVGRDPAWFNAARAMECLALICFLLAVAVEIYQDVYKIPPPADNKALEALALAAGLFGLIGVAIFGAEVPKRTYHTNYYGSGSYSYYSMTHDLQWGYGLTTAGSILVLICAGLIAYSRVVHRAQTDAAAAAAGFPAGSSMAANGGAMIPMQQMPPGGYGYMPPNPYQYPYPYPYPYPPPPTTSLGARPPQAQAPLAVPSAQGLPTSQIPVCYVMNQGVMVPVYGEVGSGAGSGQTTDEPTYANNTSRELHGADGKPIRL